MVIDAKNALLLRLSTTTVDMGATLEVLTSQLCLYDTDNARLTSIKKELKLLMEVSSERELDLDFNFLEKYRSSIAPYESSFTEKNHLLYYNVQPLIDAGRDARAASLHFLKDPMSVREYRLPPFTTSQR